MQNSVLAAFMAFVLLSGCASQAQTFRITLPDGPFVVLDGTQMIGGGNFDQEESWFRIANVLRLQIEDRFKGYSIVEIEKDSGIVQDDFEGKSSRRTVMMTSRPSVMSCFKTKDGRGIILHHETSELGYEKRTAEKFASTVLQALSANEELPPHRLVDLPDNNVFVIMIANGENDGEVVIRKQRRGSDRSFLGITTTLESVLTLVGLPEMYVPTEDELSSKIVVDEETAQREAEEFIRELEQSDDDSKQGD